ncbi:MAG TPA: hemerythrin domain-containing protein [Caulobacteraceae bacterium]|nr:hemerythrin domain-containing protein [Caulobacteraceae bacterium]
MSLALNESFRRRAPAGVRLGARLGGRADVMVRAADKAMRLAARTRWPRMAGAVVLGFVAGAAVLGGRRAVMQAAGGLAGDWFAALKADHRLVDRLFGLLTRTEETETAKRQLLFARIAHALARHQFEEEHVIYPSLLDGGPAKTPKHLDAEHFEMKSFVHELTELPKDDPHWLKKAEALRRLIQAHVREEEEIVFPRLRERLTAKENAHLTRALHREGRRLT